MREYCCQKRPPAPTGLDLRDAIERGDFSAVKTAIADCWYLLHLPTGQAADYPVHVALQTGQHRIVRLLLQRGADPNAGNAHRRTPLHLCVLHRKHRCIGMLISRGADPAAVDNCDHTPLDLAMVLNEKLCLETLLNYEMPKTVLNKAFFRAATQENTIMMNKLLNRGADIEYEDKTTGLTALVAASRSNLRKTTQFLLEKGANPAARDLSWYPCQILVMAVERGDEALIDSRTRDQETALHLAAKKGYEAAALVLIRAGARLDPVDRGCRTPLLIAVQRCWYSVARCLVDAGAAVNRVPGAHGQSPLHAAVACEDPSTVQLLLDHGAVVVGPRNDLDWTIVHRVCESGDVDILERLLAHIEPAVLDALHENGRPKPPLVVAASMGHGLVVSALLARGVDVNVRRDDGETALHAAVRASDGGAALVDTLLDAGACIDARDTVAGLRPLDVSVYAWGHRVAVTTQLVHSDRMIKAVVRHDVDAVAFLLACGVSPNVTTEAYGSPLHLAVRHKRYRMIAAILASRRCRTTVRYHGHTPLDYALAMGDGRAAKMILLRNVRQFRCARRLSVPPTSAKKEHNLRTANGRRMSI